MSRRMGRQSLLCIGEPGAGKTTLERRITDAFMRRASIDSVFVLDRQEEWSIGIEELELEEQLAELERDEDRKVRRHDGPIVHSVEEYHELCRLYAELLEDDQVERVPERVIWRCGDDPARYVGALREAVDQGNVMVVFAEGAEWFPNYLSKWPIDKIRDDVTLAGLWRRGRAHIRNRDGARCRFHIVVDTQYPMQVHWYVRDYSETVLCSALEGADSLDFVRRNYGKDGKALAARVQGLEKHQWIAVRGEMPELAAFRGGGRA